MKNVQVIGTFLPLILVSLLTVKTALPHEPVFKKLNTGLMCPSALSNSYTINIELDLSESVTTEADPIKKSNLVYSLKFQGSTRNSRRFWGGGKITSRVFERSFRSLKINFENCLEISIPISAIASTQMELNPKG